MTTATHYSHTITFSSSTNDKVALADLLENIAMGLREGESSGYGPKWELTTEDDPSCTCQHDDTEECMNCEQCGQCSESLNEDEICSDCLNPKQDGSPEAKPALKHLTPDQRVRLRELASECNLREFLLCVSGIVRHDVEDFAKADEAGSFIIKAANTI